jgi:hypothetical protein
MISDTITRRRSINAKILNFISSATGNIFYVKSEKFEPNLSKCNVIFTDVCSRGKL